MRIIFFSLIFTIYNWNLIESACDNQCSGNGVCSTDDICQCYANFGVGLSHQSGDCSDRICPYDISWADTPDFYGTFHKYTECSSRGICDRGSGQCNCFTGYEGVACQRQSCPNDCSGHGTCEYIEDLTLPLTWNDYTSPEPLPASWDTVTYNNWDKKKVRACVCDPLYGDFDCSKRMCPYGPDILDELDDLLVNAKYQTQTITFVAGSTLASGLSSMQGQTFALTFTSRLNESFTTIPIVFDPADTSDFANDIKLSLVKLPNQVITGITVNTILCYASSARVTAVPCTQSSALEMDISIEFSGDSVQGPQNILFVENYYCGDGCTPKITGLSLETKVAVTQSSTYTTVVSDFRESYECGRRGKCDYTTGLCACFLGYTGENCNTQTTLV